MSSAPGEAPPRSATADDDELGEFGYKQELDRTLGTLRDLRGGDQLHLDPHRHLPALLLRLRLRRTGLLVVVADGLRRPAHGRAVLRRAGRQVPGRGLDLQLGQAAEQPARGLAGRLDDAHGVDRDRSAAVALAYQITLPQISRLLPVLRRRHGQVRLRRQRGDPRHGADHLHDDHQRHRRQADGAHQQHRRLHRADRGGAADRRRWRSTSRAGPTSSWTPRAAARTGSSATSAPSWPPRWPRPTSCTASTPPARSARSR